MSDSPPSAPPEPVSSSKKGLLAIFLTVFMDLIGFSIIFPLFPDMLDHYLGLEGPDSLIGQLVAALAAAAGSATPEDATFVTTVLFGGVLGSLYAVLQFIFAPLWGAASDRLGRRKILLITITGTAVSYALWFVAGNFVLLITSRLLGGLMAGNISVASAAIADVTSAKGRASGMALIGVAFGLGFILGPAFGGMLVGVDLTRILSAVPGINPFSTPALAAFLLCTVNLVWVITRFPETLDEETKQASIAQRRPTNPAVMLRKVGIVGVDRINRIQLLFSLAFTGMEFTLVFLAKDRFGFTPLDNAKLFVFVGFVIVLIQGGVVRRLTPRIGERKTALLGLGMMIPGLFVVGLSSQVWMMFFGMGIVATGSALFNPAASALVSLYAPAERQGEILGIFRSLGSFSRAVGPLIACGVYWKFGSAWPYYGAALLMLGPLFGTLSLHPPNDPGH